MSDTVKRIKKYIDFKGVNTRRFEESIGFSNGAFASQYKHNRSIGVDKVEKILQVYPDLNPVWLLTGVGNMLLPGSYDNNDESRNYSLSEPGSPYENGNDYKDKYIRALETENELLRQDVRQKQEIIQGFLSGTIQKAK